MYNNNSRRPTNNRSFGPRRDFGGGGEERRMYDATCDKCGRDCQLPFRPNGSKPVYCSNCFEKSSESFENRGPSSERFGGGDRPAPRPRIESRSYDGPDYGRQINELNAKLDKIISLLISKDAPVAPVMDAPKKKKEKKVEVEAMPEAIVENPKVAPSEE